MKAVEFLLQTLQLQGVKFIFGNPGTTEIPLVRACENRAALKYVVALSEVAAVPMADGYARATRSLGVVNLHVAPGLGNGSGALYTAGIAGTPLLVLVGAQDTRFAHTHPILHGPLEQMAGAVTKGVFGLHTTYDAAFNIRRALRLALTPPFAPVALTCPSDLLESEIDAEPQRVSPPALSGLNGLDAKEFADFLARARRPALILAEDVHWSDASHEVMTLAENIGAAIFCAPYTGILPVASATPHFSGYLSPSRKAIAQRLGAYDALLFMFTLEPPVIDFSGLARLYSWRYHCAKAEPELTSLLSEFNGRVQANTLIELCFDPSVKPVTAARHF